MKSSLLIMIEAASMLTFVTTTQAQVTVTIDLSNASIGMERSGDPDGPAPDQPEFSAYTWTCGGTLCIGRTLMTIDLSSIPENSTITNASLSLYADPECTYLGWYGQPTVGARNAGVIRRVMGEWDKNTLNWNNRPPTTTTNQVLLPNNSNSVVQDFPNVDLTGIIQSLYSDPAHNYGIILKMVQEHLYYNSLIFGSPLNSNSDYFPVLTVTYLTEEKIGSASPDPFAFAALVSPNPSSEFVTFEFSNFHSQDQIIISVYDLNGREIMHANGISDEEFTLNISELLSGIYYYKALNETNAQICDGKFMKQ